MNCPRCNNPDCEECADEVDIGVGVQKFIFGYDCPTCGQIAVCRGCGHLDPEHAKWCPDLMG